MRKRRKSEEDSCLEKDSLSISNCQHMRHGCCSEIVYYRFLYNRRKMRYDETGSGITKQGEEETGMIRNTVAIRHEHHVFLLCSLQQALCFALQCPEKMRVRDLLHPAC